MLLKLLARPLLVAHHLHPLLLQRQRVPPPRRALHGVSQVFRKVCDVERSLSDAVESPEMRRPPENGTSSHPKGMLDRDSFVHTARTHNEPQKAI